jgi:AraC family transcriptional regulator, regulatory protein of adaptative response / methylated-DNA-[protein]-cysteine methyltransferase
MELVSISSNNMWAQVMARDIKADGRFVYAVKSTGVFCRPSCPSRRPRREMVEFFGSPADAQQAGYRACRRCTPTDRNAQLQKVEEACRLMDHNILENPDTTLNLAAVASHVELSPFHFQRLFKRTVGISPRQYQQARRAGRFRSALQTEARITDAIYEAGYSSSSRAYETVHGQLGMTPSAFRRRGAGVKISFSIVPTKLGKLLIATTERGVCAVRFGDSEAALTRELKSEFKAAEIQRDDRQLADLTSRVEHLLQGSTGQFTIPLDVQGTAFQQIVWQALRQIPRGETRSYSDVARTIGKPRAIRAVATACASNPVALVVPCHRVVQKSGNLAGYRWGLKRKAALLELEKARA